MQRCGRDRGPGSLLPGGAEQGRPLRRLVLLRRHLNGDLLSTQLPGPDAKAAEHALLPHGGRSPAGRLPGLPALPARCDTGLTRVERAGRCRGTGHAAHPRRHRRPRGRGGPGPPARVQHPPAQPPRHRRGGDRSVGPRPSSAQSDRPRALETTDLPITQIAFAAGFASVRQCNETVRQIFADTPSGLRARCARTALGRRTARGGSSDQTIRLRLPCRRPFDPTSVLDFLSLRTLPAVETCADGAYRRSLRLPHGHAVVSLTAPGTSDEGGPAYVEGELMLSDLRDLTTAVSRCRQLLDLDADPIAVWEALGADPALGSLVQASPGRRVPGAVDGFELAVRAVIGQQVSVAGARTVAGKLVLAAGEALPDPEGAVTHLFPTPAALAQLAEETPTAFAMPANRRRALARWRTRSTRVRWCSMPVPTPTSCGAPSSPSPASVPGPPNTWPCGPCATPTPSCRPTSASAGAPPPGACPRTRGVSWPMPKPGGRGGVTPWPISGRFPPPPPLAFPPDA